MMLITAIQNLVPNAKFELRGNKLVWNDERPQPSEEEINSKIAELEAAEPMRLLRQERNRKLAETDWTQSRDVILENDAEWKTYRKALRDLPTIAEPQLDSQGNLTNVTWPEVPA